MYKCFLCCKPTDKVYEIWNSNHTASMLICESCKVKITTCKKCGKEFKIGDECRPYASGEILCVNCHISSLVGTRCVLCDRELTEEYIRKVGVHPDIEDNYVMCHDCFKKS